jgi:hypothetical protein
MKQSFIVFETSLLLRFLNERARMGNFTTGYGFLYFVAPARSNFCSLFG